MQFGMTFIVDLYDFDRDEAHHVLTLPGDYIRRCEWAEENLVGEGGPEVVGDLRRHYATVWFALKRRGRLAELGLPEELDKAAVDAMADRFSIYVNDVEEGDLPLAKARGE